jgi:hypothetical protein
VNVTSQQRFVDVRIPSLEEGPGIDEFVAAPDNAPFDQTLDHTLNELAQTNSALASQVSSFGEVGDVFTATAQGTTSYSATSMIDVPGAGMDADSSFAVTFTLAEARDYTINGSASFPDTTSGSSNFRVALLGPGGIGIASFTKSDFDPALNDGTQINPTFGNSGTLPAGEYMLFAESGVGGGTNPTGILASYSMTFTATLDGTEPPPPGVIPLPAAAWPGVMMLSGLGVAAWKRRRTA